MATGVSSTHRPEDLNELMENIHACCSPCKENDRNTRARHYCVDCEMYFCTKCLKDHNKFPSLKSHQVNDVQSSDATDTEDATQSEEATRVPSGALRCTLDQDQLIDTHCTDHDEVCCGICAVVKHRSCTLQSTVIAAKDFKSNPQVNKSKQELTELLDQLKQAKKKRTENLGDIEKEKLELIKNVDNYEEKHIAKVKRLADTTRGDIRSRYEEQKSDLDNDIGALDAVITNTELHRDKLENINDEILFGNVKMSKIVTNDAVTILQAMTTDWRNKILHFNFDMKLENLLEEMKSLGQLVEESQSEEESAVIEYSAKFQKYVSVKQSSDADDNDIVDICKLDSGDLLFADYENRKLKRFNDHFQFIDEIALSDVPKAICKISKDEVAVRTSPGVVQFVSVGQSLQFTSSLKIDEDEYGLGMAYDADAGELFICMENKVCVYSKTGTKLRTYDNNANGEKMFSSCRQIAVCEKQHQLYVADDENGLVVLDLNGMFITRVAVCIQRAWPLCVLPGGVCLVGSYDDGTFVQIFENRGNVGRFIDSIDEHVCTNCVLYDREHSRLIIGGNPSVCVYTLSRHPK